MVADRVRQADNEPRVRYIEAGGVRVSAVGLGAWQFGSREWSYGNDYANKTAGAIVRRAIELGINLIDSAEFYGFGRSERIVGEAIRGQRDRVFIATKIFPIGLPFMTAARARASARRLGVAAIELYQQHWPSPLFPPGPTMRQFRRLLDAGLIKHAGVSNHSLAQWEACDRALGRPVLSNQVRFSLVHREPERELVPWASENGRLIIAYSPLGQGLLSGKYQSNPPSNFRRVRADFSEESRRRREPLIGALREIGARHSATPAQIALAWLLSKPNVVVIPGASSVAQLEENAAASDVELDPAEIARLEGLAV